MASIENTLYQILNGDAQARAKKVEKILQVKVGPLKKEVKNVRDDLKTNHDIMIAHSNDKNSKPTPAVYVNYYKVLLKAHALISNLRTAFHYDGQGVVNKDDEIQLNILYTSIGNRKLTEYHTTFPYLYKNFDLLISNFNNDEKELEKLLMTYSKDKTAKKENLNVGALLKNNPVFKYNVTAYGEARNRIKTYEIEDLDFKKAYQNFNTKLINNDPLKKDFVKNSEIGELINFLSINNTNNNIQKTVKTENDEKIPMGIQLRNAASRLISFLDDSQRGGTEYEIVQKMFDNFEDEEKEEIIAQLSGSITKNYRNSKKTYTVLESSTINKIVEYFNSAVTEVPMSRFAEMASAYLNSINGSEPTTDGLTQFALDFYNKNKQQKVDNSFIFVKGDDFYVDKDGKSNGQNEVKFNTAGLHYPSMYNALGKIYDSLNKFAGIHGGYTLKKYLKENHKYEKNITEVLEKEILGALGKAFK